jgi:hypothetical protein
MSSALHILGLILGIAAMIGVLWLRISSVKMYNDSDTKVQTLFGKDRWWT